MSLFGGQQLGLTFGDKRVNDFTKRLAFENLRQLIERQVDAVVRYARLRIVVSANPLGAIAATDLATALGGAGGVLLLALEIVKTGAKDCHRLGAIAML